MRYHYKPLEVDAVFYRGIEDLGRIALFCPDMKFHGGTAKIIELPNEGFASPGDWIVLNPDGNYLVYSVNEFDRTFEDAI